jgi:tetratricopeptide (TPR) repeat protein
MLKRVPLLLVVSALAIWLGNFIIYNFLGSSLLAYGVTGDARDLAASYSPSNPAVIAARGKYLLNRAEPLQPAQGIIELERAAELSPNDYRYWLELGRALDSVGEESRAAKALGRAVELSPRYFDCRWTLANFFLRAGKNEQAVEQFREALKLSGRDRPDERAAFNIYNSIAGAYGNDLEILSTITPSDEVSQALLGRFLATRDSLAPDSLNRGLEIWRKLPIKDEAPYRALTAELLRKLLVDGRFEDGRKLWDAVETIEHRRHTSEPEGLAPAGQIIDGGFERQSTEHRLLEIGNPPVGFGWIVLPHAEVRDRQTGYEKHSGSYSRYLGFAASMTSDFDNLAQLIVVQPGQQYRLRFFVKTKNIPSDERQAPSVEVVDAIQPERFSVKQVVPAGTSDWRELSLDFTPPPETRGVQIRIRNRRIQYVDLARMTEVWFDDFSLENTRP